MQKKKARVAAEILSVELNDGTGAYLTHSLFTNHIGGGSKKQASLLAWTAPLPDGKI